MATVEADQERSDDPYATIVLGDRTQIHAELMERATGALSTGGGRFVPIRAHARGGLGEVFLARDEELGREVALKAIQGRFADDPSNRARFVREAEITGNLEHPGIVPVYGLGRSADGRPYYAMRFIQGESLEAAIARFHAAEGPGRDPGERSMALLRLLGRFNDVCNAISYAHSRGIVHRDLKPSNVMLGEHGETLVVDWGLAKALGAKDEENVPRGEGPAPIVPATASDQTMPGSAVGTPAYMSPEQAAGRVESLGTASDVYNLGATLYCLLAGQPPFDNAPVGILLTKVQRGDFLPPRAVAFGEVPPALEAICLKAMALRPEDRYPSADALAAEVERWIVDEPVAAYPESASERLSRWSRRHRTWVRAGSAVVLGLLAVLAVAMTVVHRAWTREQSARFESERLATSLDLDAALNHCERGATGRGMIRLAHALSIAPADARELRRVILSNLAGWGAPMAPLRAALRQRGPVRALAYRPDGKVLAIGGGLVVSGKSRGEARLWDLATGRPLGSPLPHLGPVGVLAFRPDGKVLLTGSADRTARLWDAETGAPQGPPILHQAPVSAVAFSPDGESFLTASGDLLLLWESKTQRPLGLLAEHPGGVLAASFSRDGRFVASGGEDGQVRLFEVATRRAFGTPMVHQSPVCCLAFGPDGRILASGTEFGVIRLWEFATQHRLLPRPSHGSRVCSVAFSPDGRTLLSGSEDNTARFWDVGTGGPRGVPVEHLSTVAAVAFRPDGKMFSTGSTNALVRLWEPPGDRPLRAQLEGRASVLALAPSPDGRSILAAGSDRTVRVWDVATRRIVGPPLALAGEVQVAAYRRDGKAFVTGCDDGRAQLWDATTFAPIGRPLTLPGSVTAVACVPGGSTFLAGGDDEKVHHWDPISGRELGEPLVHETPISAMAIGPDDRTLITLDFAALRTWGFSDGVVSGPPRRVALTHPGGLACSALSRDGRLVATGGEDNTARIWEAATGRPLGVAFEHHATVEAVAFSPDGRTVLTGCNDLTARLWSVETGRAIGPPMRHLGRVSAVAWLPDGQTVATGGQDRVIRLWETPVPLSDDGVRVGRWVQGMTGMILRTGQGSAGLAGILESSTWVEEQGPDAIDRGLPR